MPPFRLWNAALGELGLDAFGHVPAAAKLGVLDVPRNAFVQLGFRAQTMRFVPLAVDHDLGRHGHFAVPHIKRQRNGDRRAYGWRGVDNHPAPA